MHWNWSQLCGRGVDTFATWSHNDFGHCFELLVFSCTTHAIFLVISAYYIGQHRHAVLRTVFLPRHWALHVRFVCALFLCILPVLFAVLTRTYLEIQLSLIDVITACIASASWLIHSGFVARLHYDSTRSLRGPTIIILSFLLTFATQCIRLRTVILHVTRHSKYLNIVEEYVCFVSFGICLVYTLTLIPSERRNFTRQGNHSIQENDIHVSAEGDSLLNRTNRITYGTLPLNEQPEISLGIAEDGANCLSKLFFCWVNQLMVKGSRRELCGASDVFYLPKALHTTSIENLFKSVISTFKAQPSEAGRGHSEFEDVEFRGDNNQRHSNQKRLTLLGALNKAFGWQYYLLGILKLLADLLGFCGPILLNLLVSYMENAQEPIEHGYLYAAGLFLSTFLMAMLSTHFTYQVQVLI